MAHKNIYVRSINMNRTSARKDDAFFVTNVWNVVIHTCIRVGYCDDVHIRPQEQMKESLKHLTTWYRIEFSKKPLHPKTSTEVSCRTGNIKRISKNTSVHNWVTQFEKYVTRNYLVIEVMLWIDQNFAIEKTCGSDIQQLKESEDCV